MQRVAALVVAVAVATSRARAGTCSGALVDAASTPDADACQLRTVDSVTGTITFTEFCVASDCLAFLSAAEKVFTPTCRASSFSYTTYYRLLLTQVTVTNIRTKCDLLTNGSTPATTSPKPTTATPVTVTTTPVPVTTTPVPVTTTPEPVASATENRLGATTGDGTDTPKPATASAKSGSNATTIAAVVGGGVVLALLVVLFGWRQRQRSEHLRPITPPATGIATVTKRDDTYTAFSDGTATTETQPQSSTFPDCHALVPFQIPYNRLRMGRAISHGGYGEVVRGTYNHQDVAIKRLLPARRDDPHSRRSFVKEIRLTATLQHECVVRFVGAAWDNASTLCMVSEYMDGGDLRKLLVAYENNGHANGHDDTKIRIAVQVAHAMTYLHSLDPPVVHRDLKSRNILLSATGNAKLIDFGVSCERQDVTMTAGIGTSLWMAPEVMLGKHYDEKADVFSFGVILSELDTHEIPYEHAREAIPGQATTDFVLLQLISTGKLTPRFTDTATPAIVALARDCLQLDPMRRPTARDVLHRIDQCLQRDRTLTSETRSAIHRALLTTETRATTRPLGFDSVQRSLDTRDTTRATSP